MACQMNIFSGRKEPKRLQCKVRRQADPILSLATAAQGSRGRDEINSDYLPFRMNDRAIRRQLPVLDEATMNPL